jgi:hypothetical protein
MARGQIIKPDHLTRREWAKRLNEQWEEIRQTAVDGFVQLGRDLHEAKADLGEHGKWQEFVENDLKFNPSTARAFMRIAAWADNADNVRVMKLLPPDWGTLDKLTRLDDDTFAPRRNCRSVQIIDEFRGLTSPSCRRAAQSYERMRSFCSGDHRVKKNPVVSSSTLRARRI